MTTARIFIGIARGLSVCHMPLASARRSILPVCAVSPRCTSSPARSFSTDNSSVDGTHKVHPLPADVGIQGAAQREEPSVSASVPGLNGSADAITIHVHTSTQNSIPGAGTPPHVEKSTPDPTPSQATPHPQDAQKAEEGGAGPQHAPSVPFFGSFQHGDMGSVTGSPSATLPLVRSPPVGEQASGSFDVIDFLKAQHGQMYSLLARIQSSRDADRHNAFIEFRKLLAMHETAEEQIVHPVAKVSIPGGKDVVAARLREEHKVKSMLVHLEGLDMNSNEFDDQIALLEQELRAHNEAEEREELENMLAEFDRSRLERMRVAVEYAEAIGPTRPHPALDSSLANMFAGPFTSMVDRMRDFFSGKMGLHEPKK